MLIARQLLTRHFFWGNTLVGLILLSAGLLIPRIIPTYRQQDSALQPTIGVRASPTDPPGALPEAVFGHAEPTSNTHLSKLSRRVGVLRHKFIIQYPLAGSNIDTHVELTGLRDVIFYMPRATQIGLFSPFPHMWFTRGAQVGLQGRLWAGVETLWMYAMTVLAIVCVVRNWRKYSVCLTSLLIVLGCTALGYVVVNIATLYRMRYGFWILLMILGARGLLDITIRRARSSRDCQKQDPLANA